MCYADPWKASIEPRHTCFSVTLCVAGCAVRGGRFRVDIGAFYLNGKCFALQTDPAGRTGCFSSIWVGQQKAQGETKSMYIQKMHVVPNSVSYMW